MNEFSEMPETEPTPEQKEMLKHTISRFIEDKVRAAAERYIADKPTGHGRDIVEYLLEDWTDNDGAPAIRRPIFQFEGYGIRFESQSTEYDHSNKRFSFALSKLRQAETEDEIRDEMEDIVDSIYHEAEHIYTPGADLESDTGEGMVKYLCNPGEIEAYGRQFARRYAHEYPNEEFNMEHMEELAEKSKAKTGGARNLYHYMTVFNKPERASEFSVFGDVKAARESVIEATQRHLMHFKSQQQ
jgi:hypothetical protein